MTGKKFTSVMDLMLPLNLVTTDMSMRCLKGVMSVLLIRRQDKLNLSSRTILIQQHYDSIGIHPWHWSQEQSVVFIMVASLYTIAMIADSHGRLFHQISPLMIQLSRNNISVAD